MKSVIANLQTQDFPRIRIGIGRPTHQDNINYVLNKIQEEEYRILEEGIKKATLAVEEFIKNGMDTAMNKYN